MPPRTDLAASRRRLRLAATALALPLAGACAGSAAPSAPSPTAAYRIYDAEGRPLAGMEALVAALRDEEIVFVGEQHDDPVAHRFELELLQALARQPRPVTVALEMFERDVQQYVDAYVGGSLPEPGFLAASRPWPNYVTDYRPLVEWARAEGRPVVASNVPRPLAAAVAQRGLDALQELPADVRWVAARDVQCPEDEYYQRFAQVMQQHPGPSGSAHGSGAAGPTITRLYHSQCVKDETMAEAILQARQPGGVVVHFNGAFHSDFQLGIVPRIARREPGVRTATLSLVPAADPLDARTVAAHQGRADFVILTRASAAQVAAR